MEGDITAESVTAFVTSNSLPLVTLLFCLFKSLSCLVKGGGVQLRHGQGDLPGQLQQPSPHVPLQGGAHYEDVDKDADDDDNFSIKAIKHSDPFDFPGRQV